MKYIVVLFSIILLAGSVFAKLGDTENNKGVSCERNGDIENAVEWYIKAANLGSPTGQYNLGRMFANGKATLWGRPDYEEAVYWYKKAAEQGLPSAQNNLGDCYEKGNGVEQDYELALKWYRKAAAQDSATAYYSLGICYEKGIGVKCDYDVALTYYKIAMSLNDSRAKGAHERLSKKNLAEGARKNNLGKKYEKGVDVPQDYTEAVKYYHESAKLGCPEGQYNLGRMYANGNATFLDAPDYVEAVKLYRLAAEQGFALAQNQLGMCYEEGKGVEQNYIEAVKYYRLAAEQDCPEGQYNLGRMYANGHATPSGVPDYVKAVERYRLAAKQGLTLARYQLGKCHKEGTGVVQDFNKAIEIYSELVDEGYEDARLALHSLYERGYGRDIKNVGYVEWVKRRAECGYDDQVVELAKMYETGNGMPQDLNLAVQWFVIAAGNNISEARLSAERLFAMGYGQNVLDKTYCDWLRKQIGTEYGVLQSEMGDYYLKSEGRASEAAEWYHLALQSGNIHAKDRLLTLYEEYNVEDLSEIYIEWLNEKGKNGDTNTLLKLVDVYKEIGDRTKTFETRLLLAKQGYVVAQREVADCYMSGIGVLVNHSEALMWYREAVKQGDSSAKLTLHEFYSKGMWEDPADPIYLEWLHEAARDQKLPMAQFKLAQLYETGTSVQKSITDALKLYRLASQKGYIPAQKALYKLFQSGYGEDINDSLYVTWLQRGAQNNLFLQFKLAQLFEKGSYCLQRDLALAEKGYILASKEQTLRVECYYRLGEICLLPERCDYQSAIEWFKKGEALQHDASRKRLKDLAYIGPLTRWMLTRMNKTGAYHGYPEQLRGVQMKLCLCFGISLFVTLMIVIMFFVRKERKS